MKAYQKHQPSQVSFGNPGVASPGEPAEVFLDAVDLRDLMALCGLDHLVSNADWARVESMGAIVALVDPLTSLVEHYRFDDPPRPH